MWSIEPFALVGWSIKGALEYIGKHLGDICHRRDTAVARHMWTCQNGDFKGLKFMDIDRIFPTARRDDLDRLLLQRETFWIYTLKTMVPGGLNEQLQFNNIIE